MLPQNCWKLRVGFISDDFSNGRSLSRMCGPFNLMMKEDPRLEIHLLSTKSQPTWHMFGAMDVCYFLDPWMDEDVRCVAEAKAQGCRVWCDYIDNLLNVPPSNPVFKAYMEKDRVRANMKTILSQADVVTATVPTLADIYKDVMGKDAVVRVLPESCLWPQCPVPRKRCISWRGLGSHNADLESVLPQLHEISRMPQYSKWDWLFIGEPSWRIYETIPPDRLISVPFQSPQFFMNTWGTYGPFIHIVPLLDNPFNRGKTPLVWLEATAIGAMVIARNLPEWRDCKGIHLYDTPEGFGMLLRAAMDDYVTPPLDRAGTPIPERFHRSAIDSREDVYPAKTTKVVNKLRWEILEELWAKGKK